MKLALVRKTIRGTPSTRVSTIARVLGWSHWPVLDDEITPGEATVLWLADYLQMEAGLSQTTVDMILATFHKDFEPYGAKLYEDVRTLAAQLQTMLLVIADNRYCTVSDSNNFLDLHTGHTLHGLSIAPTKSTSYNLCKIFFQGLHKYEKHGAATAVNT